MRTPHEEKSHKRKSRAKRALTGAAVTLALLGAMEVGFRVIADGHPDNMVRLMALALSMAAGAFVASLRGGGSAVLLVVGLSSWSAQAGDVNRSYNVTISSSACPTGTPGLLADGKEPGLFLGGLKAWNVTICPTSGETFTGAGLVRVCVFRRSPGPNKWTLSPTFYWDMSDDGTGNAITSTVSNPCVTFGDVLLGVNDADLVYAYPETSLGVSGGTAISVYLKGQINATP